MFASFNEANYGRDRDPSIVRCHWGLPTWVMCSMRAFAIGLVHAIDQVVGHDLSLSRDCRKSGRSLGSLLFVGRLMMRRFGQLIALARFRRRRQRVVLGRKPPALLFLPPRGRGHCRSPILGAKLGRFEESLLIYYQPSASVHGNVREVRLNERQGACQPYLSDRMIWQIAKERRRCSHNWGSNSMPIGDKIKELHGQEINR